ncbi:hypothetical protein [Harryflintia acetispora]|uniref:Uncharacterized protein n=1 Tax=Harryflintia acetispora TaxID=1849041 RepID=A0A9X8UL62_9FIRM|nr:hypothetical protein [Harryflintia acetispora]TCL45091.1 hypothetical protein EDD78_10169 [Harryflintia acetispora]
MKARSLARLLVSCCLTVLFPVSAAAAATVQVELGENGSYGVHIPFTPSPRTERYTFSVLEDGAEVFRAGVTVSGGKTDIYLPFGYDPSGPQEYTLRVRAHVLPGREGLDQEASVDKPFITAPSCGCPAGTAGAFYAGKGTAAEPYQVASAAQLQHINSPNHLGKGQCFKQVRDIDVEAEQGTSLWTPIGNYSAQFSGQYDGDGHWVRNFSVDTPRSAGLFGYINHSTIQRLAIETPYSVVGTTLDDETARFCGGLVGEWRMSVTLSQCYANVSVSGSCAGVLLGVGQQSTVIRDCAAYGKADAAIQAGGVAANIIGAVERCYGICAVSGSSLETGGLVGRPNINASSTLTDCRWFDGPQTAYSSNYGDNPVVANVQRYPLTAANLSNPANFPASFGLNDPSGLWEMGDVWYYNHKDGKPGERVHVTAPKLKIFTFQE